MHRTIARRAVAVSVIVGALAACGSSGERPAATGGTTPGHRLDCPDGYTAKTYSASLAEMSPTSETARDQLVRGAADFGAPTDGLAWTAHPDGDRKVIHEGRRDGTLFIKVETGTDGTGWGGGTVQLCGATTGTAVPATGGPESPMTSGTKQPRSVEAVATAEFTQPWGCGWGFHATNPDRTVALHLWQQGPRSRNGTYSVTFPDPAWEAEVHLGRDLLTVECADQDLASNPEPAERWTVVGGTLEYTAPAFGGCASMPDPVRAVARHLKVRIPDGGEVMFAELHLSNDQWGCAAG